MNVVCLFYLYINVHTVSIVQIRLIAMDMHQGHLQYYIAISYIKQPSLC